MPNLVNSYDVKITHLTFNWRFTFFMIFDPGHTNTNRVRKQMTFCFFFPIHRPARPITYLFVNDSFRPTNS